MLRLLRGIRADTETIYTEETKSDDNFFGQSQRIMEQNSAVVAVYLHHMSSSAFGNGFNVIYPDNTIIECNHRQTQPKTKEHIVPSFEERRLKLKWCFHCVKPISECDRQGESDYCKQCQVYLHFVCPKCRLEVDNRVKTGDRVFHN